MMFREMSELLQVHPSAEGQNQHLNTDSNIQVQFTSNHIMLSQNIIGLDIHSTTPRTPSPRQRPHTIQSLQMASNYLLHFEICIILNFVILFSEVETAGFTKPLGPSLSYEGLYHM